MKILKYTLIACIVSVGLTVSAQEDANTKHKAKKEKVIDALALSDAQRAEVKALRADTKEKITALKADETLDEAAKKEEFKALRKEKKEAFTEILNDEQKAKLEELKAERKANRKEITPEEIAERQTAKMKEVLTDLTEAQEERIHNLNLKVAHKIDVIKKDESMSEEKKREFIRGNKEDKKRMLQSILTAEQLEKWEAHTANKRKLKTPMKKMEETDDK